MKLYPVAALRAFRRTLVSGPVIAAPPPAESAAEELRVLVPAPTVDEVVRVLERFTAERAPANPAESVIFARFVTRLSAAIAPTLARIIETTEPPAPPKDDAVN